MPRRLSPRKESQSNKLATRTDTRCGGGWLLDDNDLLRQDELPLLRHPKAVLLPAVEQSQYSLLARAKVDRTRIHRQIALALASSAQSPEDVLAAHFRDAGELKRAAEATAKAADSARESFAFDAAVARA